MVESLQNITRHQTILEQEEIDNSSLFVIQRLKNDDFITSGTIVDNQEVESLRAKLSNVNSFDKDSLKEYYKEILAQGHLTSKCGAGL